MEACTLAPVIAIQAALCGAIGAALGYVAYGVWADAFGPKAQWLEVAEKVYWEGFWGWKAPGGRRENKILSAILLALLATLIILFVGTFLCSLPGLLTCLILSLA